MSLEQTVIDYLETQKEPFESKHPGWAWGHEAGGCSRAIGFRIAGLERSDPFPNHTKWNFHLGTSIHNDIKDALLSEAQAFGQPCATEVDWELDGISGRADIVTADEVWELKSGNSWGFEGAYYGAKGGQPKGPENDDILQGFLGAKALGMSKVHVVYASKQPSKRKPAAIVDWVFHWTPQREEEVEAEIARLQGVRFVVADGELPKAFHRGEAITNPKDKGFPCGYCGWKRLCCTLKPERADLETVRKAKLKE
jgi:hypothetical protein